MFVTPSSSGNHMEWLLAVGWHRWLLSGRHYDHRAGRWTGEVAMLKAFADLFMRNKTRTVAGMPNSGPLGGARASFEPRHGKDPTGRHLVIKPGRSRGRQAVREPGPSDPLNATAHNRNAYPNSSIRRFWSSSPISRC